VPEQTIANVRAGVRSPKQWLKGEDIPPDHITPWELLIMAISAAFGNMSGGFTGRLDFLFKEVYRVPPNYMSVQNVVTSIWDAINDPLIGAYMDKKRYGPSTLKKIMRLSAFTGHTLNIIRMIDAGLSPFQHVFLLAVCKMTQDIIGTFDGVAGAKIRAGISPSTQQRARLEVWIKMGWQFTWNIANLPTLFMGFRDVFKWTDYQIIFIGALIFYPFAVISSLLPTLVKQRIDFTRESPLITGEGEYHPSEEYRSLRESFQVVKHNKYFVFNCIARFITAFTPNVGDELLVYRYLVPSFKVFGREMSGEGVLLIKQIISGTPSTFMQPFNRQIVNKLGGPLKAQQLKSWIDVAGKFTQFLVGYNTIPKLAVMVATETAINAAVNWDGIAGNMLNYEWYDYVELKTGERSEGVTAAVNGLFDKIVAANVDNVTYNAFLSWTGYRGGYLADGTRPPDRFMKWMWPMYTLVPVLDNLIYIICRSFVKWTPKDREETEKALAERREEARLRKETAETVKITVESAD